ncbi:LAETG motif-containing sortase-dependent surface protein [Streptomyces echinatus]|uniref:LAETG motif-containing sortase-dependent surface protein n=1 Tax=Streptomyces echinatus TaxID=67293 RepID=UPI0037BC6349
MVPEVEKWINTKPEYADLRRVYTARVAAEWIRQQDARQATDYRKIINSNDVKRWPLRAPHQGWKKTDVFNRYVKIFKAGEFNSEGRSDDGGGTPSPTPSPSRTVGGDKPPADPDGDLADTGSSTPVGPMAGIATAALAAGAAMVWWVRRRRTSSS